MASKNSPDGDERNPDFLASLKRSTELPPALRRALQPWVDVDNVGLPGLWIWLETALPALAQALAAEPTHDADRRVAELAKALVDCSTERARLNFRAYEYYSDNVVLARRVRALEGMLRASQPGARPEGSAETERAVVRYLPHKTSTEAPQDPA